MHSPTVGITRTEVKLCVAVFGDQSMLSVDGAGLDLTRVSVEAAVKVRLFK